MQQQLKQTNENLSDKANKLLNFLHKKVNEDNGEVYIKSKFIADDVGLSAKEIGAVITQLQEADQSRIEIERWSYTGATTWRVTANTS
jgi:hypothetical protein